MNKEFLLVALFGVVLFSGMIGTVYYHELAHVKINEYAGVNSHIEFNAFGGITKFDSNFESKELMQQAMIGHGVNESIGYISFPLVLMICSTIIICSLYLGSLVKVKTK